LCSSFRVDGGTRQKRSAADLYGKKRPQKGKFPIESPLFLCYYVAGQAAAVVFAGALCPVADPAALSLLM